MEADFIKFGYYEPNEHPCIDDYEDEEFLYYEIDEKPVERVKNGWETDEGEIYTEDEAEECGVYKVYGIEKNDYEDGWDSVSKELIIRKSWPSLHEKHYWPLFLILKRYG